MEIPACFCTAQYIARLRSRAESILRALGVDGLLRVEGAYERRRELLKLADDVVGKMILRLYKSPEPPPNEAAWDAFFFRALRNDALDLRGKLLEEKGVVSLDKLVHAQARDTEDSPGISCRFGGSQGESYHGKRLEAQVGRTVEVAVRSLVENGPIPENEAENILAVIQAYLQNPGEPFDSHLHRIAPHINRKTAHRWWQEVRLYLEHKLRPILHPTRGAKRDDKSE